MKDDKQQSAGRARNAALPPGRRDGLVSESKTVATGKSALTRPGPDGVDPDEIGDTFKRKP